MAYSYDWGLNPFQDFIFDFITDTDIMDNELEVEIYIGFTTILQYFKYDEKYEKYLDYVIKKKDICIKVIPQNGLTALWLSGIFPQNPDDILETNEFEVGDTLYKFNEKTKRLTHKLLKKK